jgi:hypothetical protein
MSQIAEKTVTFGVRSARLFGICPKINQTDLFPRNPFFGVPTFQSFRSAIHCRHPRRERPDPGNIAIADGLAAPVIDIRILAM